MAGKTVTEKIIALIGENSNLGSIKGISHCKTVSK